MAKTKNKTIKNPKPNKTSIFLCCFGPPPEKNKNNKASILESSTTDKHKRRSSWFSWVTIRIRKNSASKTVPLETAHYNSKAKAKSKSTLHHKPQAPATNSPPLNQTLPVHPATPYYTPSQTRHGPSKNAADDTTQQAKRHSRRVTSTSTQGAETTSSRKQKNARVSSSSSSYDAVAGMSVVVVTLVIMILWGRVCAILCTSAWLYFIPRFRYSGYENDENGDLGNKTTRNDSVVVGYLDSEEYKKKVIMEGLLERNNHNHNHRV